MVADLQTAHASEGPVDPDCRPLVNKHATCQGVALDPVTDDFVPCSCACHDSGAPGA